MKLQIKKDQGIFKIEGTIDTKNASSIKNHFQNLIITKTDRLILCLDQVKKIDKTGVKVLTGLYKSAIQNNRILFIIGRENESVRNAFGKVDYILRSDFV